MKNGVENTEASMARKAAASLFANRTFSCAVGRVDALAHKEDVPFRRKKIYLLVKRIFDVVSSAVLLCFLWFPMLLIAVWIRSDSCGPAIFRQTRVGRELRPFTLYKFRTMISSAPECSSQDLSSLGRERYLTRIGRFLRRTGIDELPQLWNVLRGEMSLVGPRPVISAESDLLELRCSLGVVGVRPGITGLAQIEGRDERTVEEKAALDAFYAYTISFSSDVKILCGTVAAVLRGTGCN